MERYECQREVTKWIRIAVKEYPQWTDNLPLCSVYGYGLNQLPRVADYPARFHDSASPLVPENDMGCEGMSDE